MKKEMRKNSENIAQWEPPFIEVISIKNETMGGGDYLTSDNYEGVIS
jgi:hypothetical protein